MKKNWILVPVLALLAAGSLTSVKAEETKKKSDYLSMSAKYDKMAVEQGEVVSDHETMKTDYAKQHPGKPGIMLNEKMDKHCNKVIRHAKALQADYQDFSSYCKLMAKEESK